MKFILKKIIFLMGLGFIYNKLYLKILSHKNQKKFHLDKKIIKNIKYKQNKIKKNYKFYSYKPKICFVLTSYNHRDNAIEILNALRNIPAEEIIVCDDGSIDGAKELWLEILDRPNEILMITNELNESFCLDRAFRSSKADILCSLQDDDLLPNNNKWITEAAIIFNQYTNLVILGGNGGNIFDNDDLKISNYNSYGYTQEERDKSLKKNKKIISPVTFDLLPTVNRFMFVHAVNLGPFFIRKKFYEEIGGYNLEHIGVGNHLIGMDWDLCFRAWEKNKYVGLYEILGIQHRVGGNMSSLLSIEKREKIRKKNQDYLNNKYSFEFLKEINIKINALNDQL